MTDFDARVQKILEETNWRRELKLDHHALARVIFPGNNLASSALQGFLNELKFSEMTEFYHDQVGVLLDFVDSCVNPEIVLTYRWEDAVRKAFEAWKQDRAIEIAGEEV